MATILAVLQNMYVDDPARAKAIIERTPAARRRLITYSLFAGCRTGQILKQIFGEDCPRRFVWEESTREIAGNPRDVFPADLDHLRAVMAEVKPDVVLSFGRIATNALASIVPGRNLVIGPHPTARQPSTFEQLRIMADILKNMVRERVCDSCSWRGPQIRLIDAITCPSCSLRIPPR